MSTTPNRPVSVDRSNDVRRELRERLLSLNFHAFASCMALVIEKMGGEDVRLMGRRNWKGRNQHGGYDLEATLPSAFGARRAIVQVKQYDSLPIYQRGIDELRGTCLRVGASEAVLITTGMFAPSVARSMPQNVVAPVRLIDGQDVLNYMIDHRIGLAEQPQKDGDTPTKVTIDTHFFDELARTHEGNSRLDCVGTPRFLVSVQVRPVRGRVTSPNVITSQTLLTTPARKRKSV